MIGFAGSVSRTVVVWISLSTVTAELLAEDSGSATEKKLPETSVAAPVASKPTEKSIQELVATARKSVVVVSFTGRDGIRQGLGSGFIVSSEGLIATNLHVIGEARPIQIELTDGRRFDVTTVHATERSQDLAIVKIDAQDLPALPLGNSDELQDGQSVIAIGNPLGLERSVVSGILSGRREIDGRSMLQLALPIERGNSGGPLMDLQGQVHGLLTLKSLQSENLGFAVAVNALKPLLNKPNPIPMSRWLTIGVLDPNEWNTFAGARWRQRAGLITVESGGATTIGGRALCLSKETVPEIPFEVAVQVRFTPADGAAGLVFHADGGDRHYGFYPTNGSVRLSRFDGPDVFSWAVLRETRTPVLKKEGWNSLKVRVETDKILCYLNGELIFETSDPRYTTGQVGLCKFRNSDADFKGFRIGKSLDEQRPSGDLIRRIDQAIAGQTLDDATANRVVEQFSKEEASVIDLLEQQARVLDLRAARIRRVATDIQTRKNLTELKQVLAADSLDLLHGALLIAKIDNPELDVAGYLHQVERHAQRVRAAIMDKSTEQEQLVALNRYLFDDQRFHGSRTDYGHRSNSYINEVLDDREGLPITLSIVHMEVARRVGLNVVGVGMPSHFLTRHEPKQGSTQLIDAFDGGRLLSRQEARKLCEELSERQWDDAFLNTTDSRAILERMLRNLINSALESNDPERMLRYTEAVLAINPDSGIDHFNLGKICYFTQRWQQARHEIEWLVNHDSAIDRYEVDALQRAVDRESQN